MNTITHNGESLTFTSADELFAIAREVTGVQITHIYRDGLRVYGIDSRPVMHEIGTSSEPVMFVGSKPREP
jgi:hypothetical protein